MAEPVSACAGLATNTDISGPGVRAALYIQTLLTILLIRLSPLDSPNAYWSMTTTALALLISSIVTSLQRTISLLDGIIVVYILFLPIIASAFGIAQLSHGKGHGQRLSSPLLIVANWTRSALTYGFALFVWIKAASFGSQPECNNQVRFVFFGASLPALGSGRTLNLALWGVGTALFAWRSFTLRGLDTLLLALRALFFSSARHRLLCPRRPPPANEWIFEQKQTVHTTLGEVTVDEIHNPTAYREKRKLYKVLSGLSQKLMKAARGQNGATVIGMMFIVFSIVMTELELRNNGVSTGSGGSNWSFGQILPMVLTISPLVAILEFFLSRRSSGPSLTTRTLRLKLIGASSLPRPYATAFAQVTIDDQIFLTYEKYQDANPVWDESFDVQANDLSVVVVRVFDLGRRGKVPELIGFSSFLPFDILPPGANAPTQIESLSLPSNPTATTTTTPLSHSGPHRDTVSSGQTVTLAPRPLYNQSRRVLDPAATPSTIHIQLSSDLSTPCPVPTFPSDARASTNRRDVEQRYYAVKIGYGKFSKTWETRTDRTRVRV